MAVARPSTSLSCDSFGFCLLLQSPKLIQPQDLRTCCSIFLGTLFSTDPHVRLLLIIQVSSQMSSLPRLLC